MTTDKKKNAEKQARFRARRKEELAALRAVVYGCLQCSKRVKSLIKGEK